MISNNFYDRDINYTAISSEHDINANEQHQPNTRAAK